MRRRRSTPTSPAATCRHGHSIGLDIGATGVRATVLTVRTSGGHPSVDLKGVAAAPLAPGAVKDGVVVDPAAVTDAVRELWRSAGFGCPHVVLGVANPQVVARDITLPDLDPQQRAQALPFQAREVIALPLDEVVLDFAQVGLPDPVTKQVRGLLVAAPRLPVVSAVRAVEAAGLKVVRVDLSSFALLRSSADASADTQAVVDLGAHLTTIAIHDSGFHKLLRTLARGGDEVTARLAQRLGVSLDEAELAKRGVGLTDPQSAVSAALLEAVRPLLGEVRSTIGYFRSISSGAALQGIALTGGGAALPGLADLLSREHGVPTSVVTPTQYVDSTGKSPKFLVETAEPPERWVSALSVGLALGAAA